MPGKVSDKLFVKKGLPIDGITYGINEGADYDAQDLEIVNGTYVFDVKTPSEIIENIELNLFRKTQCAKYCGCFGNGS